MSVAVTVSVPEFDSKSVSVIESEYVSVSVSVFCARVSVYIDVCEREREKKWIVSLKK